MRSILTLLLCLTISNLATAQGPQQPGPEHARVQEMVGTWDAVMKVEGQTSKCTAVYRSICDGMWVESDFEGVIGGQPFKGHGIDGYDLTKKKYTGLWVDSMSSTPLTFEGTYEGHTLKAEGTTTGPDGKPQKYRMTNAMPDKDHMTFQMSMVDPSGKEQLAFTIEYTRQK